MLEIMIGESDFNFWSNAVVPLLSATIGGLLTLLGGYIQTRKDIEREEKRRRWDVAKELSQAMTKLQTIVARNSYSVVTQSGLSKEELDRLYREGTQAFEDALVCFWGLRFALSNNLAESAQLFLDKTESNIKVWKERIGDSPSREVLQHLPHMDQGGKGGEAYNAFSNLSNELDKYVKKD